MRFVGIDPAASKGVALVSVGRSTAGAMFATSPVFKQSEIQRLVSIRRWVNSNTPKSAVCILVEQQFQGRIMREVGAVCSEGAQAKAPGALVLGMVPSSWRLALSGSGRMSKESAMEIAEKWGVPRCDDLAEALCMALVAKAAWLEASGDEGRIER
jgi:hypothetical protein